MICFPNAKINLGLNIVSKRADGYHNIETIFYPIGLKDALELIPSNKTRTHRFFPTGIDIGGNPENNLVIKALSMLREQKHIPGVDIHLLKTIPCGAGLGGGSSNAAFMLQLLNDTFSLGYKVDELKQFAVKLGADCAFFLTNKPAFASGIGDQLEEIELSLQNYYFVLVKPDIFVSTKEAYQQIEIGQPGMSLKEIVKLPMHEWRNLMHNDFEPSIFKKHPEIERIKNVLYDNGAEYSSMSGSGTSVYGFFEKQPLISFSELFPNHFIWKNYL